MSFYNLQRNPTTPPPKAVSTKHIQPPRPVSRLSKGLAVPDMAYSTSEGGFLPSPSLSQDSRPESSRHTLPHPRNAPLRSGGNKESAFIRYVDSKMLHIQRRFAKRTTGNLGRMPDRDLAAEPDDAKGYASMKEACKDIEELVDMIWISGTPHLQIPYLITIAMQLSTVIDTMPPHPKSLFHALAKLDHTFASLLHGRDIVSGEELPGIIGSKAVSETQKVRIRSLVERTRIQVVEAFNKEPAHDSDSDMDDSDGQTSETDGESHMDLDVGERQEEDQSLDMQIARVYDFTVVELGDSLDVPNIGRHVTEDLCGI